jgi:hypothetical protein
MRLLTWFWKLVSIHLRLMTSTIDDVVDYTGSSAQPPCALERESAAAQAPAQDARRNAPKRPAVLLRADHRVPHRCTDTT